MIIQQLLLCVRGKRVGVVKGVKRGGKRVQTGRGGVGVGVGKGKVARKGRLDDLVEGCGFVFFDKGIIGVLFHQDARGVAENALRKQLRLDALCLEHFAPRVARRHIELRTVVALGNVGEGFARGDLADGDADGFAADGFLRVVKALRDDIDPVVGSGAAQLAGGGDFQIDVAAALHREGEGVDVGERLVFTFLVIDVKAGCFGVGGDFFVECFQLGDGFIIGINLFLTLLIFGAACHGGQENHGGKNAAQDGFTEFHCWIPP